MMPWNVSGKHEPSTGKSSNSSSSSSAAEAFWGSLVVEELESGTTALVVSREPPLGAADMIILEGGRATVLGVE